MHKNDKKVSNGAKKPLFTAAQKKALQKGLIYARFLLPAITGVMLLVVGCFYNVKAAQGYVRYSLSLTRLYGNTFTAARTYFLSAEKSDPLTAYYTLLTVAAAVGVLFFLLAAFFNGFAALKAMQALPLGQKSEEANRHKLHFKMAFPNRVALAIANCLWVVPALYPTMFSYIGSRFLFIQGVTRLYISRDLPLILTLVMTALSLLLALIVPRLERRREMNMFLLFRESPADVGESEETNEEMAEDEGAEENEND